MLARTAELKREDRDGRISALMWRSSGCKRYYCSTAGLRHVDPRQLSRLFEASRGHHRLPNVSLIKSPMRPRSSGGLSGLFLFQGNRYSRIRRQAYVLPLDIRDQPQIDIMMMASVMSF